MFASNLVIFWLVVVFVTAVAMSIYLSRKIDKKESSISVEEVQVSEQCRGLGVFSGMCFGFGFGIGFSIALVGVGVLFGGLAVSTVGSLISV